jgi:hypothetical protein
MIEQEVEGAILASNEVRCYTPLKADFRYDPDGDQYAVEITFRWHQDGEDLAITWTVGRELLMRGVVSVEPVGRGDVRVRKSKPGSDAALFCLKNEDGHADLALKRDQIIHFLNETQSAVHLGDECMDDLLDEALKEILGS